MKIPPFVDDSIRIRDFSSSIKVQGHGVTIQDLKSSLYIGGEKFDDNLFLASISNNTAPRRGAIHAPWINVDLGSFNTSTIKYDMRVLASDINFKYLLTPENREKINDEKLLVNLTADVAGVGISPSVQPAGPAALRAGAVHSHQLLRLRPHRRGFALPVSACGPAGRRASYPGGAARVRCPLRAG